MKDKSSCSNSKFAPPPPQGSVANPLKAILVIVVALGLFGGAAALAQTAISVRVLCTSGTTIRIAWGDVPGATSYSVAYALQSPGQSDTGSTSGATSPYTINPEALGSLPAGLQSSSTYRITVTATGGGGGSGSVTASTRASGVTECIAVPVEKKKKLEEVMPTPTPRPAMNTCPHLPAEYVVYDYAAYTTQCQVVGAAGIGRSDLIEQGIIGAVDIWGMVPGGGVDVCIHGHGPMLFLDAAHSPRQLVDPGSEIREGMTCTRIDRAGTVVLLVPAPGGGMPLGAMPMDMGMEMKMSMEMDMDMELCQIRTTASLFLRAEPAGKIIGGVGRNSELPVMEVSGDWYKVEVDGMTGYISSRYREVLSGAC